MEDISPIIIAVAGLLFTLQGYEVLRLLAREPDASETEKLAKWQKAQSFYRWGGPVMFVCGVLLWLL